MKLNVFDKKFYQNLNFKQKVTATAICIYICYFVFFYVRLIFIPDSISTYQNDQYSYELGYPSAVLAEINNTPWDERFCYITDFKKNTGRKNFEKDFHISPFMPMDIKYSWYFKVPQKSLSIHMQNFQQEELMFDATLSLQRKEFSLSRQMYYAVRYPLMPQKVSMGIYWHAMRLWLKKVPFFTHPDKIKTEEKSYE